MYQELAIIITILIGLFWIFVKPTIQQRLHEKRYGKELDEPFAAEVLYQGEAVADLSERNFVEMFNRHPRWLPLLTPPDPVPSALAELLGREYKCISQKALRHAPGHNDYRVVPDERTFDAEGRSATPPPGWDADGFHADQVWAPSGLTADVVQGPPQGDWV